MIPTPTPVAAAQRLEELIASSFASRYDDLAATLAAASQAVALVEAAPDPLPTDLVGAAWTQHGNALRLAHRFDEAERALAKASELPLSVLPTVQLLSVKASLHRDTGRLESAASCLAAAIETQKPLGDPQGEARLHNLLGIVYKDWGRLPGAFRSFLHATSLLGPDSPADLVLSIGHNLLEALILDGQLEEASAAMVLLAPHYRRLTSARIAAKGEWLRARLCRALHQLDAARLAYDRACKLFSTDPYDAPELAKLAAEMANLPPVSGGGE